MSQLARNKTIAAISAAIVLAASHAASAQNAEAAALFEEGNKLMTAGKIAEACKAFEASNEIEPRAGALLRLGDCREQNHQLASAWSAYKDALGRAKDVRKRDRARAKVDELEPKLSHLTIRVADAARVAGLEITRNGKTFSASLWDHALPVDGGEYAIAATAPGHVDWHATVQVPESAGDISVDVPSLQESIATPTPPAPKPVLADDTPRAERADRPPLLTTRRKIGLGVVVVAAAATGVGAVLGAQATSKHHDAFVLCPDPMQACANADAANALISASNGRALAANVSFVLAGASAVGATVLWLTGKAESRTRTVRVVPTPNGVAVAGSFR